MKQQQDNFVNSQENNLITKQSDFIFKIFWNRTDMKSRFPEREQKSTILIIKIQIQIWPIPIQGSVRLG